MEQTLITLLYDAIDEDHRSGGESGGYYQAWVVVHIADEGAIDIGPGSDLDHTWLVAQSIEHHVPHGEREHALTAREFLQEQWEYFVESWSSWNDDGTVTCEDPESRATWTAAGFDWEAEVARLRALPTV